MKILFKSGSTMMGGLEKVQSEYINFLVKKRYNIKVVIENDNGNENILEKDIKTKVFYLKNYEYIKKIKNLREKKNKNILNKIMYNIALYKENKYSCKKFLKIYEEFKPDIVIDFDSSLTKIIKKLKKSKNLVWVHSSIPRWKKNKKRIESFVKRLENYDKVICICKEMKEETLQLNKKLNKKLEYIYNPVDFEKIKKLSEKNFNSEEQKLIENKFLLTISRLDCVPKDFETLFKGFDIAKDKGYDGKLYLIGDGPDKEKVENMRKRSKYGEDIYLLGKKENPYNWLKKADKLILSSRYEGFPTVLLEGLALKKKIISSNCKTGPNEILNNKRGKLYQVGDSEKLSNYIIENKKINFSKEYLKDFERKEIFQKFIKILEEKNV